MTYVAFVAYVAPLPRQAIMTYVALVAYVAR